MIYHPRVFLSTIDHAHQFQHPKTSRKHQARPSKCSSTPVYYDLSKKLRQHLIDIAAVIVNTLYRGDVRLTQNSTSLRESISRLIHHSKVPTNNILCALLYLVRLKQRHPECKRTMGAGYRLFLAALIVSNKYLYDNAYRNTAWVQVSGRNFTLSEINFMEFELLYLLNFRLSVTKDQWVNFVNLIDLKVTEKWERCNGSVPLKLLYSKATAGIDIVQGKTCPLPWLMKSHSSSQGLHKSEYLLPKRDSAALLGPRVSHSMLSNDACKVTSCPTNLPSNDNRPKVPYR